MSNKPAVHWFEGRFAHAPGCGAIEIFAHALIGTDESGTIVDVKLAGSPEFDAGRARAAAAGRLTGSEPQQYFLPGLVDLHIHAPQWPQLGKALHLPLQDWLMQCTFPLEARFIDIDYARTVYESLVSTLLANGTTTAVYFGSIHVPATKLLADICLRHGQRALVGKVVMDDARQNPPYYRDADLAAGLAGTHEVIDYVSSLAGNAAQLVRPAITPRFIPSCSDRMLRALGDIAQETGLHVQTHCSESDWEHDFVFERLGKSDAHALDDFGLMTRRTTLAHANFIDETDSALIRARGAGIAHCPLSNAYFADSVFPLRAALEKGLRVGLGTDISGGPSASMFDSCRHAIASSRILEHGADPWRAAADRGRADARIDFREAFWLATAGGGEVLDLPLGRFAPGYRFDAMLVDPGAATGNLQVYDDDKPVDVLQKIIYGAGRENIVQVWTDAQPRLERQVSGRDSAPAD